VSNAVDEVHFDESRWERVEMPVRSGAFRVGLASPNYPHKNLIRLLKVKRILLDDFQLDVDFVFTFDDREWSQCSTEFRADMRNVGRLRLTQIPIFYRSLDAVIFPSLLESFSATPIEALAAGRPLIASDLPFVTELVGDCAVYFDPKDPADIAAAIARVARREGGQDQESVLRGLTMVRSRFRAERRTTEYLRLCGFAVE
jgi:glycosyltransferase involved in cell wall biosynthesis